MTGCDVSIRMNGCALRGFTRASPPPPRLHLTLGAYWGILSPPPPTRRQNGPFEFEVLIKTLCEYPKIYDNNNGIRQERCAFRFAFTRNESGKWSPAMY